MKTAEQVYDEVSGRKKNLHLYGLLDKEASKQCMIEYAKAVIDDILSRPDMIYVDGSGNGMTEDPAVYDYDKFDEYKKQLK